MSKKEAREARRVEEAKLQRQKREMERMKQKNRGSRGAIRNEGELVERKPLTPWEQYAQALLFTNEIVYVN
jgi:hypothetical protein